MPFIQPLGEGSHFSGCPNLKGLFFLEVFKMEEKRVKKLQSSWTVGITGFDPETSGVISPPRTEQTSFTTTACYTLQSLMIRGTYTAFSITIVLL